MEPKARLLLYIPYDLAVLLKERAVAEGMSVTAMVTEILRKYFTPRKENDK